MLAFRLSDTSPLRFVSFLLRIAHDKSRSQKHEGTYDESVRESVTADPILLEQVERLSSQILTVNKTAEEQSAAGKAPGSMANTVRFVQQAQQASVPVHPGSNF